MRRARLRCRRWLHRWGPWLDSEREGRIILSRTCRKCWHTDQRSIPHPMALS